MCVWENLNQRVTKILLTVEPVTTSNFAVYEIHPKKTSVLPVSFGDLSFKTGNLSSKVTFSQSRLRKLASLTFCFFI